MSEVQSSLARLYSHLDRLALIPQGHCYLWKPGLVWLHVLSDGLISLTYFSIPIALIYFVHRRRDLPYSQVFPLFGVFIVACGLTHLLEIWTVWHPIYWVSGGLKAVTAMVSLITASELIPIIPEALTILSRSELEVTRQELQQQVYDRPGCDAMRDEVVSKQAEAALKKELLQSKMLFNTSIDGVVILNHQGNVIQTSSSFAQMLGYTIEETHKLNVGDWDAQWTREELQKILERNILPPIFETRHRRKDGSIYDTEISYSRVPLDGEMIHVCICRDISDRKRLEAEREQTTLALQESEGRFQSFMQNAPLLSWITNGEGKLLYANPAFFESLHGVPEEAIGQSITVLFPEHLAEEYLRNNQQVIETQAVIETIERAPADDGSEREYLVRKFPIYRQGQGIWVGGIAFDITEHKQIAEALRQSNDQLEQRVQQRTHELAQTNAALAIAKQKAEQADADKTRFLAAASHDLVQPLNAALLFAGALGEKLSDSEQQALLSQLNQSLHSTEELLKTLLDLSKLDAGVLQPQYQAVALDRILQPLAAEFAVPARQQGLELHILPTHTWVHTDPQLLRRVLQNFLGNAVRYTARGRILIGCRRRGDRIAIEVWDTGPGIAEADLGVIFEEFRRLDRGGQGLGLGLAIAERIARLLGHPLRLRSWPGRGTVFAIEVPRSAPALLAVAVPEPATPEPPRSRVLVVDNDADVLRGMQALLEGWRCEVLAARDGDEALRLAAGATPDLVLLDFHLGDHQTGLMVRERLATVMPPRPCVVITADHGTDVREAVAAAGCVLLHKPLKPLALKSVMARLLAR